MAATSIISSWKNNIFKPLYWLEGDEDFFIDEIIDYAEKKILTEADASFNLTTFYGKDANWADVINACRRYPMFAERQVVLLKEAQQMRDIDKLEPYIENPLNTTVLVVSYKGKTLDKRGRLSKLIKKTGEVFMSKKVYESQLPSWTNVYVQSKGFQIEPKALTSLVDHVGNDLSRLANEVDKLSINISSGNKITEDDIERYIGVSKEYNIFELQEAFSSKNAAKAMRILQFFEANPKAVPVQLIMPSLYGYFTKVMVLHQMPDKSSSAIKPLFYHNPFLVQQAVDTMKNYSYANLEKIILLLHEYNLKMLGVNSYGASSSALLKELVFKMMS